MKFILKPPFEKPYVAKIKYASQSERELALECILMNLFKLNIDGIPFDMDSTIKEIANIYIQAENA